VEQALGYLAWRAGQNEPAKQHFARAVNWAATTDRPISITPKLLQGDRANDEVSEVGTDKDRGTAARPFRRPHVAGFHYYNTHDYPNAIDQLGKVKNVAPEAPASFYQVLAYSTTGIGKQERRRPHAEKVRQYARTPEEIGKADELLKFVNGNPSSAGAGTSGRGHSASRGVSRPEKRRFTSSPKESTARSLSPTRPRCI